MQSNDINSIGNSPKSKGISKMAIVGIVFIILRRFRKSKEKIKKKI